MYIGESITGNEGKVTRINLKTIKKVWYGPQGSYQDPVKTFKELKKRVALLPPEVQAKVNFIYPRRTIKEKGRRVSYFRYIPGKHFGDTYDSKAGKFDIEQSLGKVGIRDWNIPNVIQHSRTKKLYFIDPRVYNILE